MISENIWEYFPTARINGNALPRVWKKIIGTSIVAFFVMFNAGCVEKSLNSNNNTSSKAFPTPTDIDAIKDKIRNNLIGTGIVYRNVAGRSIIYNVTEKDIKTIEKTVMENRTVWKVRVGSKMAWDIYFNETGEAIVKKEQLFVS